MFMMIRIKYPNIFLDVLGSAVDFSSAQIFNIKLLFFLNSIFIVIHFNYL